MEPPPPPAPPLSRLARLRALRPPRLSPERRDRLGSGFQREAASVRGQALGLLLMITPAIAHPLPLPSPAHTAVLVMAVVLSSVGTLIVFGGMLIRAVLEPARPPVDGTAAWDRSYGTLTATGSLPPIDDAEPSAVDDALLRLPHRRGAWLSLVLLGLALAAGSLWCFVLLITGDGAERLPDALLLGLPALALGGAAGRSRVMWTGPTVVPPAPAASSPQS